MEEYLQKTRTIHQGRHGCRHGGGDPDRHGGRQGSGRRGGGGNGGHDSRHSGGGGGGGGDGGGGCGGDGGGGGGDAGKFSAGNALYKENLPVYWATTMSLSLLVSIDLKKFFWKSTQFCFIEEIRKF